jgi:hypothetical protein
MYSIVDCLLPTLSGLDLLPVQPNFNPVLSQISDKPIDL